MCILALVGLRTFLSGKSFKNIPLIKSTMCCAPIVFSTRWGFPELWDLSQVDRGESEWAQPASRDLNLLPGMDFPASLQRFPPGKMINVLRCTKSKGSEWNYEKSSGWYCSVGDILAKYGLCYEDKYKSFSIKKSLLCYFLLLTDCCSIF